MGAAAYIGKDSVVQTSQAGPHLPILRRAGLALIAVGLVDIAYMVHCIASEKAYSSSLNVFAVAGGVFLFRGSLKAASITRPFLLFLLSGALTGCLASPAIVPMGLLWIQARLGGISYAIGAAAIVAALLLLAWSARQLGSPAVLQALAAGQVRSYRPVWPIAAGIGLALLAATGVSWMQRTDTAQRAIHEAREKHGDGYRYFVSSMQYRSTNAGSSVSGLVMAWNDDALLELPFRWSD